MEFALLREMMRFNEGDDSARAAAVENTRKLGLGRFRLTGAHLSNWRNDGRQRYF